ncbi:copper amine oxidase N-terminal domain-containing protein [Paenibacillus sp. Leaf72]|uniref:copper amine oxidase N-terminal domain-containing protein n=1 Tax=Paenibacillus sp. Leaf72 TaxID=1736234 RepID=UPI0006F6824C|nr:copper amine oxidase N-terminal domain-containing protein [Paenibacillus sp. Leaf72]KQO18459.1 hypothetical protein ASF12_07575 [Paenibacillus sp. Leaf72]
MLKKKWLSTVGIALLALMMISVQYVQAAGISLIVNGSSIEQKVPPVVKDGKVLISVKNAADMFESKYHWDNQTKTLTLSDDKFTVLFVLERASAIVTIGTETTEVALEQSAQIVNGSLMVPARFLVELYGGKVVWDQTLQTLHITMDEAMEPALPGAKGDQGDKGDKGETGSTGATGAAGAKGDKGDKGDPGATGATGAAGAKGDKGDKGDPGAAGPVGPAGPIGETGSAGATGPAGTSYTSEGFSAAGATTANSSMQFISWSVASPHYSSPTFNAATGIFTVPETGKYAINATVNYNTTASLSVSLGSGVNPIFTVKKNANSDLIKGNLPILNVNMPLVLTMRALLESATVTLSGDVQLQAGDQVGLYYEANGLTINFNMDAVWSIHRLS